MANGLVIRVLMLGPGLDVRGGISSVEQLMLSLNGPDLEFSHIATTVDGGRFRKVLCFGLAWLGLLFALVRHPQRPLHLHFASRGSFLRKAIGLWTGRLLGHRVVLHAHGGGFPRFFHSLSPRTRHFAARTIRRADALLVQSCGDRRFYTQTCGLASERVYVVPNPVDLPDALPPRRETATVCEIGYLGGFDPAKGFCDLLEGFSRLPEELRRRARLWLGGPGDAVPAVDHIRRLHLEDSVRVMGWLSPPDRNRALNESDLLVIPSHLEALPMVMLEAFARGVAVMATRVGSIPEYLHHGHNGWLVEPHNPEELARGLAQLIATPELRRLLARSGRESARAFGLPRFKASLLAVYRSLDERVPS